MEHDWRHENWIDEQSPPESRLIDAYRTGRFLHRYEWYSAVNACAAARLTKDAQRFISLLRRSAQLPAKVGDDLTHVWVLQQYYDLDLEEKKESLEEGKMEAVPIEGPIPWPLPDRPMAWPLPDCPKDWPLPDCHWSRICFVRQVLQGYFSGLQQLAFELGHTVDDGVVSLVPYLISTPSHNNSLNRSTLSDDAAWGAEIKLRCREIGLDDRFLATLDAVMLPLESSRVSASDLVMSIDATIRDGLSDLDVSTTSPAKSLNVKCDRQTLGKIARGDLVAWVKPQWMPIVISLVEAPYGKVPHSLMETKYGDCGGGGRYPRAFEVLKRDLNLALNILKLTIVSRKKQGWQLIDNR